jgi:glycyl-tRNA synthetase
MSIALLSETAQLRWWTEDEINFRQDAIRHLHTTISKSLMGINKAWVFHRTEGPMLVPRSMVAPGYTEDDLWMVRADIAGIDATMRPETTASSYTMARHIIGSGSEKDRQRKLPLCVWQVGKSYRRESTDGASASKLRFFEFTQAEWQCIYSQDTKADYRAAVVDNLKDKIEWLCATEARVVPSDRLPGYSTQTDDIEILQSNGRWTEVSSISTRTDFENANVLEIAIGMDRIVDIAGEIKGLVI